MARKKPSVTLEPPGRRILASGVAALGTIKNVVRKPPWRESGYVNGDEVEGRGPHGNRSPNGDYWVGIEMEIVCEDGRRRISKRVHQIAKNRPHLIGEGKQYPVKFDPNDPEQVEIDWDNYQRVDGKKVLDRIVTKLATVLRQAGYRKVSPRIFNCVKEDGLIHVVDLQASRDGDGFTMNAAVYLRDLRRPDLTIDEARIEEWACPRELRWRVGALAMGRDVWWSYETPDETAAELIDHLTGRVLPHLQRYESRALVQAATHRAKNDDALE